MLERYQQIMTDSPLEYFFNFDLEEKMAEGKIDTLPQTFKESGINDLIKFVSFPMERNHIQLRLENLSDKEIAVVDS